MRGHGDTVHHHTLATRRLSGATTARGGFTATGVVGDVLARLASALDLDPLARPGQPFAIERTPDDPVVEAHPVPRPLEPLDEHDLAGRPLGNPRHRGPRDNTLLALELLAFSFLTCHPV